MDYFVERIAIDMHITTVLLPIGKHIPPICKITVDPGAASLRDGEDVRRMIIDKNGHLRGIGALLLNNVDFRRVVAEEHSLLRPFDVDASKQEGD